LSGKVQKPAELAAGLYPATTRRNVSSQPRDYAFLVKGQQK
jgi:hypothetical protein